MSELHRLYPVVETIEAPDSFSRETVGWKCRACSRSWTSLPPIEDRRGCLGPVAEVIPLRKVGA